MEHERKGLAEIEKYLHIDILISFFDFFSRVFAKLFSMLFSFIYLSTRSEFFQNSLSRTITFLFDSSFLFSFLFSLNNTRRVFPFFPPLWLSVSDLWLAYSFENCFLKPSKIFHLYHFTKCNTHPSHYNFDFRNQNFFQSFFMFFSLRHFTGGQKSCFIRTRCCIKFFSLPL